MIHSRFCWACARVSVWVFGSFAQWKPSSLQCSFFVRFVWQMQPKWGMKKLWESVKVLCLGAKCAVQCAVCSVWFIVNLLNKCVKVCLCACVFFVSWAVLRCSVSSALPHKCMVKWEPQLQHIALLSGSLEAAEAASQTTTQRHICHERTSSKEQQQLVSVTKSGINFH